MKTPIHTRLVCCWLAFMVLLGSTGFGMVEHWCQMRGHSKSLLIKQSGCAKPCTATETDEQALPDSGGPTLKKLPCCKTKVSFEHLDVSRFVADGHGTPTPQPVEFIPNPQFRLLLTALLPVVTTTTVFPLADDPLHQSGRSRLISLCTWLI